MNEAPGPTASDLSYCGEMLQGDDRDRFIAALLGDPSRREQLFALYAFNLELARIAEKVSEPMLGHIRLEWWREALTEIADGRPRRHQGVLALADMIENSAVAVPDLLPLISAREWDVDERPIRTIADLLGYVGDTAGTLGALTFKLCTGEVDESGAAHNVGMAYGLAGLMRALPFHIRARRYTLPDEVVADAGLRPASLQDARFDGDQGIALRKAVGRICDLAQEHLDQARRVQPNRKHRKTGYPAFAFAVLAEDTMNQLRKADMDPYNPALASRPMLQPLRLMIWRSLAFF